MINQTCPLILKDLYFYDVVSAFPTIMNQINYDFKNTDLENKTERNIFIGKEQKNNEVLSSYLNESIESLLSFYLMDNSIKDDDVIITQKDGFILKKQLTNNDRFIEIKLRGYIDFLILSLDRKNFLYCCDQKIIVKGISYFYDKLNVIYDKFLNLNYYNKKNLFNQLEDIKNSILQNNNKSFFCIPTDNDTFLVSTYKGNLEIKNESIISISLINKYKYFEHYFKGFLDSIFLTCY